MQDRGRLGQIFRFDLSEREMYEAVFSDEFKKQLGKLKKKDKLMCERV